MEVKHFMPAFEEGMKQQKEEILAITSNAMAPDFKNTIEALEYSGEQLDEVSACFFNLCETNNSPEMNEIAEKISPVLSAHADDIYMNEALFSRVKAVYDKREALNLSREQQRLLEETYKHFERGGVNLPEEKQEPEAGQPAAKEEQPAEEPAPEQEPEEEILELASSEKPFAFTIMTMDTHFGNEHFEKQICCPNGY